VPLPSAADLTRSTKPNSFRCRGAPDTNYRSSRARFRTPTAEAVGPESWRHPRKRMGRQHKERSWDLVPFDTCQRGRSGSPGDSTLRHLPSSGFEYPLDGLLPADCPKTILGCPKTSDEPEDSPARFGSRLRLRFAPVDGPSTAQHPWGFPFRVLLLPARGAPLGASPLLSFPGFAQAPTPESVGPDPTPTPESVGPDNGATDVTPEVSPYPCRPRNQPFSPPAQGFIAPSA